MNPIFFRSVARTALRAAKPASAANRALSLSAVRRSGAPMPALFGEGSKPGEVPTDINQSTGLDRLQILGALEGVEVFDLNPLDASRVGTLENPILVYSLAPERQIGCTGSPADSHDIHWYNLTKDKTVRCGECGSAHKMDYHGPEDHHDHH